VVISPGNLPPQRLLSNLVRMLVLPPQPVEHKLEAERQTRLPPLKEKLPPMAKNRLTLQPPQVMPLLPPKLLRMRHLQPMLPRPMRRQATLLLLPKVTPRKSKPAD